VKKRGKRSIKTTQCSAVSEIFDFSRCFIDSVVGYCGSKIKGKVLFFSKSHFDFPHASNFHAIDVLMILKRRFLQALTFYQLSKAFGSRRYFLIWLWRNYFRKKSSKNGKLESLKRIRELMKPQFNISRRNIYRLLDALEIPRSTYWRWRLSKANVPQHVIDVVVPIFDKPVDSLTEESSKS
jgi:hypothetical protein